MNDAKERLKELKTELQKMYNRAVQKAIDSGEPYAIVLADNPATTTIESVPLHDYVAEHGYGEAVFLHAHEEAQGYGKPVWVIAGAGGEMEPDPNAFEEAWQKREYYYEFFD